MGTATTWFKFSLSSQLIFYLLSLVNPYLSATINIPTLNFSFGALTQVLSAITGRIIGTTNIAFINQFIIPIIIVINITMAVIIVTPTQN